MTLTNYFAFAVLAFMCIVSSVVADSWGVSVRCGTEVDLRLEHLNQFGSQGLIWSTIRHDKSSTVCSDDEVICIKDVVVWRESCAKVVLNFKVQYADIWSRYNSVVAHGYIIPDIPGYSSNETHFYPSFEDW